jgi:hypothetical protein
VVIVWLRDPDFDDDEEQFNEERYHYLNRKVALFEGMQSILFPSSSQPHTNAPQID